jgi:hypothetical protein
MLATDNDFCWLHLHIGVRLLYVDTYFGRALKRFL